MSKNQTGDCLRKAADLLAVRPHFRRELEFKLERRGFPAEEIEAALDRLGREGLLDDRECASALAAGPLQRKGYGPRRMLAEMRRRGCPDVYMDEAIAGVFPDGDLEMAGSVAEKWQARRGGTAASLARHLESRGFSGSTIAELVHRYKKLGE